VIVREKQASKKGRRKREMVYPLPEDQSSGWWEATLITFQPSKRRQHSPAREKKEESWRQEGVGRSYGLGLPIKKQGNPDKSLD